MTFTITQQDNSPSLLTRLGSDVGDPVNLDGVSNIHFYMEDKYERQVISDDLQGSVNIVDAASGDVEYVFDSSETATIGEYKGEFVVEYNNGSIETFPTTEKIQIEIVEGIQ